MTMSGTLPKAISAYADATNAHNIEALMATFADDALVNDVSREFWGSDKIRPWLEREITGAKVTMDVVEVIEHHGDIIVRAEIDGEFDKTDLPDPLVLTSCFSIGNGKISQIIITNNKPAP
jgi:ketosteroid isomerase-like protein